MTAMAPFGVIETSRVSAFSVGSSVTCTFLICLGPPVAWTSTTLMPSWVTAKAWALSAAKATATGRKPTDTPKVGSGLPGVALASEMNVRSWKPWFALAFVTRRASVQAMAQLPS